METSVNLAKPASNPSSGAAESFLSVRDLMVHFPTSDGVVKSVNGLSFDLRAGETLGIVGESGSGKSVSSMAIMGLHWGTGAKISGEIVLDGTDLLQLTPHEMRRKRGQDVAMIFQDPLSAMHPYYTVGNQIMEAYRVHNDVSKAEAKKRAIEMLDRVGIPNPDRRINDYPHQFSGGMRQRAMIAMGLINNPESAHRRRADHRARRDRAGADPRPAPGPPARVQLCASSSSPTTWASWPRWPTTCWSCTPAVRSSTVRARTILTHPEMPYTWGLLSSVPDVTGDSRRPADPDPRQPAEPAEPADRLCVPPPVHPPASKVPGDLCRTTMPDLVPGQRGAHHTKRCHLADSDAIYQNEVLPEIAPDLAEDTAAESAEESR